jgi:hypothetical protein
MEETQKIPGVGEVVEYLGLYILSVEKLFGT